MLHKIDPFIRFASDVFGISYEEGEETIQIKDKHLIVAALGIRNDNPKKNYTELYPFGHLFPYDGRAIIDAEEALRLNNYYHLTDHLDGKYPFFSITDKTYKDSSHDNIPRRVVKTLEKLFDNEGFAFILLCDYDDPKIVLGHIHDSCRELNEALKSEPAASNFGSLAATRDFLPQFDEHFSSDKKKKDNFKKIQSYLAEIEYHYEEMRKLAIFVGFTAQSLVNEES